MIRGSGGDALLRQNTFKPGAHDMKVMDKIKQADLIIIKALYDKWKPAHQNVRSYDAESCSLQILAKEINLPAEEMIDHLQSLSGFDFVELDQDQVKLLPSGIKYALGHFDDIKS